MSGNRYNRLSEFRPWHRGWAWRLAGVWMVVLALGLAIVGVAFSIQQASTITQRLMAQTETLARLVADRAEQEFDRKLHQAFEVLKDVGGAGPLSGATRAILPPWIDAAARSRGTQEPQVLFAEDQSGFEKTLSRLRERLRSAVASATDRAHPPRPELIFEAVDGSPVALACRLVTGSDTPAVLWVAKIHPARLREDILEPLIPRESGLELAPASTADHELGSLRLGGVLRAWSLKPTATFLREQRRAVLGQMSVSLGLTLLGLVALLVAMGVLVRLVRREVALAEMKANFVADVSHELKTPLALIHMFAETLQSDRVSSDEKRREYYDIMLRESTRLTNLINNILDFARIDAGRKEYRMEPTDIAVAVRETYEAYRSQLDHHGFEHHLSVDPSLPTVKADRDAIAQALINLINNAVKYSPQERYLAIDVTRDTWRGKHGVLILVHDRGIGIKPEDRARIFEGFFRSADGRVREQSGTGLGLSLVKHIVESHGGILDVESRLVKGTTFRIFLPADPTEDRGPEGKVEAPGPA